MGVHSRLLAPARLPPRSAAPGRVAPAGAHPGLRLRSSDQRSRLRATRGRLRTADGSGVGPGLLAGGLARSADTHTKTRLSTTKTGKTRKTHIGPRTTEAHKPPRVRQLEEGPPSREPRHR